jgi:LacI family gluconate utilization system Gnt-I transcriptional repressor
MEIGYTVIVINPRPALNDSPKRITTRTTGRSTLVDVASLAGVTTMTVSRFLREPSRVSAQASARIREALAATGYTPNKQAGSLASGKSLVVAAVIPKIGNSAFAETVQALCDSFQGTGHELLLAATNYSLEREEDQVRTLLGWMPSALIIVGRRHSPGTIAMMRAARDKGMPVLEIWDKSPRTSEFIQVGFDHHAVGAMMAQHLIHRGYSDLAYVDTGEPADFRAHERSKGFVQHAERNGCSVVSLVAPAMEPVAAGRSCLQQIAAAKLPRAMAFANDHIAIGAYLQAQSLQLAVPGRLAIMGFGNFAMSAQLGDGISSVEPQRYRIGQAAAAQVLAALGKVATANHEVLGEEALQPQVVQRAST